MDLSQSLAFFKQLDFLHCYENFLTDTKLNKYSVSYYLQHFQVITIVISKYQSLDDKVYWNHLTVYITIHFSEVGGIPKFLFDI